MTHRIAIPATALLFAAPLAADTNVVATDPVGVLRYVFQANSDTSMSLPLHRPTEFAGAVGAVGSNWITAAAPANSPIDWTADDWTYGNGTNANNTYYAMFTTGALEGAWFEITGNNSNTLFLDTAGLPGLASAGVAASNTFEIIPFWTPGSLFPNGDGFIKTTDVRNPKGYLLIPDSQTPGVNLGTSAAYFYLSNAAPSPASGWYKLLGGTTLRNDEPLPSDTYYLIRNLTSLPVTNFGPGAVPMHDFRTPIGRMADGTPQDVFVSLNFPVDTSLIESGLQDSPGFTKTTDVRQPKDYLLVYDNDSPGLNKGTSAAYFFFTNLTGSGAATGWYKLLGGTTLQNTNKIFKAGQGYIVRLSSGPAGSDFWVAQPPYSP